MCSPGEVTVRDSEAFEQQIYRIHELLEDSGAEVKWDDHIPDPDNPSQPRQIDISIRRDGKLTTIECRQHERRQDVQWVEELMGRRASLRADTIIGVSSSGFTTGALNKAGRYGIVLRDLRQLTDLEVKSWGGRVTLTLYFYQYSDLKVSLCFKRESIPRLDRAAAESELASSPAMQSLFHAAAHKLGTFNLMSEEHSGLTVDFGLRVQLGGFQLSGEPVLEIDFRGSACLISKDAVSPAAFAYEEPDTMRRDATVEKFCLGETSIVYDGSRLSVFLDISQVEMPPFCQFRFFRIVGAVEMEHQVVELVGVHKLWVLGKMNVNICSL